MRANSTLRGLLRRVSLDLPAHPLTRTPGILCRQATVKLINVAQLLCRGRYFTHDFSLKISCNFDLAIRSRLSTVSIGLSVISAISPTLN
jgi:hypothetical protein